MWQSIIYYAIILKTAAIKRYISTVKINANKIYLTNLYYFFERLSFPIPPFPAQYSQCLTISIKHYRRK